MGFMKNRTDINRFSQFHYSKMGLIVKILKKCPDGVYEITFRFLQFFPISWEDFFQIMFVLYLKE